jgi:hypothetical protein
MVSTVVGVAGDEVSLRWLAVLKIMKNNTRRRRCSGELPADSGAAEGEPGGGAVQRGEKGVNGMIRVDGGYL